MPICSDSIVSRSSFERVWPNFRGLLKFDATFVDLGATISGFGATFARFGAALKIRCDFP
ncbi:hypothetical protein JOC27_001953 [Sporolactobacillus spathodeae]|uniref:Uncharacterized protein n=1 Tax=Sporolactobacillus spathodeae TaxID=1465502 RepID=A0ABS2QAP3_9BACL|nr:hypothetical protein [Sporolactobacillus spathodeae]